MLMFGNTAELAYFTETFKVVVFSQDFVFTSSIYNGRIERSEKSQDANFESRTVADVSVFRIRRTVQSAIPDGWRYDCGSTARTRL